MYLAPPTSKPSDATADGRLVGQDSEPKWWEKDVSGWVGLVMGALWLAGFIWTGVSTEEWQFNWWAVDRTEQVVAESESPPPTLSPNVRRSLVERSTSRLPSGSRSSPVCSPYYYGGCVPNVGYDVDCVSVVGPVYVYNKDPYGLDADNDGIGCEWG